MNWTSVARLKGLGLFFILIIFLYLGYYAIAWPYMPVGWRFRTYPMPTVAEVLANPPDKSPVFEEIFSKNNQLCMKTAWEDLMSIQYETYAGDSFYLDAAPEGQAFEKRFQETAHFAIDGQDKLRLDWEDKLLNLLWYNLYVCTYVGGIAPGRYVAQFSFQTPSDDIYSYTWVFERTADGVIPEVISDQVQ